MNRQGNEVKQEGKSNTRSRMKSFPKPVGFCVEWRSEFESAKVVEERVRLLILRFGSYQ